MLVYTYLFHWWGLAVFLVFFQSSSIVNSVKTGGLELLSWNESQEKVLSAKTLPISIIIPTSNNLPVSGVRKNHIDVELNIVFQTKSVYFPLPDNVTSLVYNMVFMIYMTTRLTIRVARMFASLDLRF